MKKRDSLNWFARVLHSSLLSDRRTRKDNDPLQKRQNQEQERGKGTREREREGQIKAELERLSVLRDGVTTVNYKASHQIPSLPNTGGATLLNNGSLSVKAMGSK